MTQKIFDTDNAEDMALLWSILPNNVDKLTPKENFCITTDWSIYTTGMLKIDFHDKTEITRPIQEATEADIGKICAFWNFDCDDKHGNYGILTRVNQNNKTKEIYGYEVCGNETYDHCRRLTKQEIEELC